MSEDETEIVSLLTTTPSLKDEDMLAAAAATLHQHNKSFPVRRRGRYIILTVLCFGIFLLLATTGFLSPIITNHQDPSDVISSSTTKGEGEPDDAKQSISENNRSSNVNLTTTTSAIIEEPDSLLLIEPPENATDNTLADDTKQNLTDSDNAEHNNIIGSSSIEDEQPISDDSAAAAESEVEQTMTALSLPDIKKTQIRNYRNNNNGTTASSSLILNIHVTHHAGTAVCDWARNCGLATPSFACMGGEELTPLQGTLWRMAPWNDTELSIATYRPDFDYLSWEWIPGNRPRSFLGTDWDHPNLVSILVIRSPLERLLSDVGVKHIFGSTDKNNMDQWWDYAKSKYTNNYALSMLMKGEGCCQGTKTSQEQLENAKALVRRFTFVVDIDCLDESLLKISSILNITNSAHSPTNKKKRTTHHHDRPRLRYPNDDIYKYLAQRNEKDIELYEWAREHEALVKCNPSPYPAVNVTGLDMTNRATSPPSSKP